jgi:hypothetical protein
MVPGKLTTVGAPGSPGKLTTVGAPGSPGHTDSTISAPGRHDHGLVVGVRVGGLDRDGLLECPRHDRALGQAPGITSRSSMGPATSTQKGQRSRPDRDDQRRRKDPPDPAPSPMPDHPEVVTDERTRSPPKGTLLRSGPTHPGRRVQQPYWSRRPWSIIRLGENEGRASDGDDL